TASMCKADLEPRATTSADRHTRTGTTRIRTTCTVASRLRLVARKPVLERDRCKKPGLDVPRPEDAEPSTSCRVAHYLNFAYDDEHASTWIGSSALDLIGRQNNVFPDAGGALHFRVNLVVESTSHAIIWLRCGGVLNSEAQV